MADDAALRLVVHAGLDPDAVGNFPESPEFLSFSSMLARRSFALGLAPLFVILALSSPVRAWTRSVVNGAQAKIDLGRDGTARVDLRLDVEVQAGWLHELELVGLGTGLVLDRAHPPYLRSEEGQIYRPDAEVDAEGRIHLSFSRREAPRRGDYRVFIHYGSKVDVSAVEVEGKSWARVVWTLPAWETGLQGVWIELRAPKGTSLPDSIEMPAGVDVQITERANGTVVKWHRIHLPRTTPWSLTVDVPAESFALPTPADSPSPPAFEPLPDQGRGPFAWTLLAVAILVLLKRRAIELTAGRNRLFFGSSWPLVLSSTAAIFATGQCLGPEHPAWAIPLIAWALPRPLSPEHLVIIPDFEWRPARFGDLPKPKIGVGDLFDCSTTLGIAVLALGSAGLFVAGQPAGALVLLPVFLCATRHHCTPCSAESTALLRDFISELRLPSEAPEIAFAWEVSSAGRARLRLHLPSRRTGLCALSFVVACSSNGFVLRRHVMLLVETRAQSDADDLVRRRLAGQANVRKLNGVISRLTDWNDEALKLVRALGRKTPKPVMASRGTWLLREIAEPSKKAA
jgi:hypothetical protein